MTISVSATQFVVCVLSMLKKRGIQRINLLDDRFDEAFVRAFNAFEQNAAKYKLEPEFSLAVDPLSGQSVTLRDSISKAAQLRYVSLDNPEFVTVRLSMGEDEIADMTERGPIPSALLMELTTALQGTLGSSAIH